MKTAICIASGPSLTKDDVDYCRGKGTVYVVKETALLAPWANIMYAADFDWWINNEDRWRDFKGEKWTIEGKAADTYPNELKAVKTRTQDKWSNTPGVVATGGNSGFQIINMAVLDGAERVILLGYDFGYDKAIQNKHWWDDEHPRNSRYSNYAEWIRRINEAAPLIPVPVLNASRQSAINCFERVNLRDVI